MMSATFSSNSGPSLATISPSRIVECRFSSSTADVMDGNFCSRGNRFRDQIRFRSEEHTSELQSHSDLVCRLLLEKKKETQRAHLQPQRQQLEALLISLVRELC